MKIQIAPGTVYKTKDGGTAGAGEEITVSDSEGAALVACGSAVPAGTKGRKAEAPVTAID